MTSESIYYKKDIPHRWYKRGSRLIQVTPSYMIDKETRVFHYQYIENGRKGGCCIVGFKLLPDFEKISKKEWEKALTEWGLKA